MKTVESIQEETVGTIAVNLQLPSNLLGVMNVPKMDLSFRIKELIALELFREGRISTGKAAELLEISKIGFIQLLQQRNINYFTEAPDELIEQVKMGTDVLNKNAS